MESQVPNTNKNDNEPSTASLETLSISDGPLGKVRIRKLSKKRSSKDISGVDNTSEREDALHKCNQDELEEELKCSICSELFICAVTLNCSHSFCQFCILTWRKRHSTCPLCRRQISTQTASSVVDNCVEKIIEYSTEETKTHRNEVIEYRNKQKDDGLQPDVATPRNGHTAPAIGPSLINELLEETTDDDYDNTDDMFFDNDAYGGDNNFFDVEDDIADEDYDNDYEEYFDDQWAMGDGEGDHEENEEFDIEQLEVGDHELWEVSDDEQSQAGDEQLEEGDHEHWDVENDGQIEAANDEELEVPYEEQYYQGSDEYCDESYEWDDY